MLWLEMGRFLMEAEVTSEAEMIYRWSFIVELSIEFYHEIGIRKRFFKGYWSRIGDTRFSTFLVGQISRIALLVVAVVRCHAHSRCCLFGWVNHESVERLLDLFRSLYITVEV